MEDGGKGCYGLKEECCPILLISTRVVKRHVVRFVRIMNESYDPLSSRELHLIFGTCMYGERSR